MTHRQSRCILSALKNQEKRLERPADGLNGRRVNVKDHGRIFEMNRVAQAFIEGTILGAILASLTIALVGAFK